MSVRCASSVLPLMWVILAGCSGGGEPAWQPLVEERIERGPLASDGFAVRPGEPREVEVDVPARSALRFAWSCVFDGPDPAPGPDVRFRVEIGGEPLLEKLVRPTADLVFAPECIDLPPGKARLRFEVEGAAVWLGVHDPTVGPRKIGVPGDRPWRNERANVVVFLADTFRADNLTFYGGSRGVSPELDLFAAESLRFRRAWASSSWTLPSHASLFLGLHPNQHGAVRHGLMPAKGLTSIAERLRAGGYRTAAVTDSLYVSRTFGLDRGFAWFEEHGERSLDATLRSATRLLGADDGRPLFLFVQTYQTHEPYGVSARTLGEHGERLGVEATWEELRDEIYQACIERMRKGDRRALELARDGDFYGALRELSDVADLGGVGARPLTERLRSLYLASVVDLDRAFGAFLDALEHLGLDGSTWVLFTSDHGEAFAEHDNLFHGQGTWEEVLSVPLLVRGPGLAPRTVEAPASLVDLPQTLADIAGIAPDPGWMGRSLLSLGAAEPIYAFDCAQRSDPTAALLAGDLKVVFPATREAIVARTILGAFDLAADPAEGEDLRAQESDRVRAAFDELANDALELLRGRASPQKAELDARTLARLKAAGYMGSGDD